MELPLNERKHYRAHVIRDYVQEVGYKKIVIFTCGSAGRALKEELHGQNQTILTIGPGQDLETNYWWSPEQIAVQFPDHFDATSGHLAMPLLRSISAVFKHNGRYLIEENTTYTIKTGSGETIVAMKMAFPKSNFIAVYGPEPPVRYEVNAPMNTLVEAVAKDIIWAEQ